MRRWMTLGLVGLGLSIALAFLTAGASAAPTSFTLTFTGAHVPDASLPVGVRHEGRFTASAPFCSSGHAVDTSDVEREPNLSVLRVHTCDDGTGSFTAFMPVVRGEHGGRGAWKIVDGSGRYATLRGIGTYTGEILSGSEDHLETMVYRTTWQGVVAFDASPPTIGVKSASTKKLRRPHGAYTIRVRLEVRDDVAGNRVVYSVNIKAGSLLLADKDAATTSGEATISFRIRPPRNARSVQVIVTGSDPVGNGATAKRAVKLR
jgi:hypothetical protein